MFKSVLPVSVLILLVASYALAQQPDLPISGADAPQPSSVLTPDSQPAEPADQVPADAIAAQDVVTSDCGCQESTVGACCNTHHQYSTLKEKCAYYRSIRQSFDRGPCCAHYFGGFGPLWDTYCADRQGGCFGHACGSGCSTCSTCARPHPRLHRNRAACSACDAGCCDSCASVDAVAPVEGTINIGPPPEPQEADAPSEAATQLNVPADINMTSARRGWINRTLPRKRRG